MRVFCPKCGAGYKINDELIKVKARRLKCGSCGEVFTVDKTEEPAQDDAAAFDMVKDAMSDNKVSDNSTVDKEQDKEASAQSTDQNSLDEDEVAIDIEDIFERLSERTENLINEEKKLPFYKKIWLGIKNILGLQFRINWKYTTIVLLIIGLVWMYNNRYEIVRKIPPMNTFFKTLGIKAKVIGEGLEFQNISWDLQAENDDTRLDIRGFVFNQTEKDIVLPIVHIEILDNETALLQSQNTPLKDRIVRGGEKIPLALSVSNPAPTMKYVYMTFIDVD